MGTGSSPSPRSALPVCCSLSVWRTNERLTLLSPPSQTLQMGIGHFSGLFLLLCIGVGGALLTLAGEHGFYQLVLPHIRRHQNLKYWLHTSQVRPRGRGLSQ